MADKPARALKSVGSTAKKAGGATKKAGVRTATRRRVDLGEYDGKRISKIVIAVTNAGDGLSKKMAIDPVKVHLGEVKHLVLRSVADKAAFSIDPDDAEAYVCTITLKANLATIVDGKLVQAVLDAQQDLLDEAEGRVKLPFEDDQTGDTGSE